MRKLIHVNQHVLKVNHKTGARNPVFTVKTYCGNVKANSVLIDGPCEVIYSPDKPLSCGARAWISTCAKVTADGVLL